MNIKNLFRLFSIFLTLSVCAQGGMSDLYEAKAGEYIEGTAVKYLAKQNITVFKYRAKNKKAKKGYFALVGKYGFSVRTTLGKKVGGFSYGGPKSPRTITKYTYYHGEIVGNQIHLSKSEYTRISKKTAHMKAISGQVFEDKGKTKKNK